MKIYNYDIFEGLSLIADNSVDLVFVDPPYNLKKKYKETTDYWEKDQEYLEWVYSWLEIALKKNLKTMVAFILCVLLNIMHILIFF